MQIEATVESVREIADRDENFLIVLARTDSVLADEGLLNHHRTAASPNTWDPLIFSYRTYRSLGREAHRTGLNASGTMTPDSTHGVQQAYASNSRFTCNTAPDYNAERLPCSFALPSAS